MSTLDGRDDAHDAGMSRSRVLAIAWSGATLVRHRRPARSPSTARRDPACITGAAVPTLQDINPKTWWASPAPRTDGARSRSRSTSASCSTSARSTRAAANNVPCSATPTGTRSPATDSRGTEIAFMAVPPTPQRRADCGRREHQARQPGVADEGRDPLGPGSRSYVYLFRKKGDIASSAGAVREVLVQPDWPAKYKKVYKLQDGPNPENSLVDRRVLPPPLLGPLDVRPHRGHRAGSERRRHPRPCTRPLVAPGDAREREHVQRPDGAFIDEQGRHGATRSVRTSARTAVRTPQRDHICLRPARGRAHGTVRVHGSRASWTSSTTAPRRSA